MVRVRGCYYEIRVKSRADENAPVHARMHAYPGRSLGVSEARTEPCFLTFAL